MAEEKVVVCPYPQELAPGELAFWRLTCLVVSPHSTCTKYSTPAPLCFSSFESSHGRGCSCLRQKAPGRLSSACEELPVNEKNSRVHFIFALRHRSFVGLCEGMPPKSFFAWDIEFLMWEAQGLIDHAATLTWDGSSSVMEILFYVIVAENDLEMPFAPSGNEPYRSTAHKTRNGP